MTTIELFEILLEEKPSTKLRERKEDLFSLIPELRVCDGFDQKSVWHQYDVLEHIFHVIDNVDPTIELRLAALFHDIAKPATFKLDSEGRGHFPDHDLKSSIIFKEFARKHSLNSDLVKSVSTLIYYHDLRFYKMDDQELEKWSKIFSKDEIERIFNLEEADLLAQNEQFHYLLDNYKKLKEKILSKYERSSNDEYHI